MGVQITNENTNVPFILTENSLVRNCTILQDAGRTVALLQYTVMAYNATGQKWVPFTSLVATNGESMPRGIYLGDDIPAADLVAGDIEDCEILVGNAIVNRELVVFDEDTLNADSIVNPVTVNATSAEFALAETARIVFEDTESISSYDL
jgi:hypothetical protein